MIPAWHLHPDVLAVIAAIAIGWGWACSRWGRPTWRQRSYFWSGLGLFFVFSQWPIHEVAEERLFSIHMTQHLVFSLVAVPLVLLGTPAPVLGRLLAPARPWVRQLSRPLPATLLFNAVIVLTHIPVVVAVTVASEPLHLLAHLVLVAAAGLMWMAVLSPLPEIPRLADPGRMLYVFMQSIVPTVPASFLTFAENPLYRVYAEVPRLWGISAVADQQMAGAVMKIGGGALLWGVIVVMFFRWSSSEERRDSPLVSASSAATLTWADVERELARTPAPPEPR